MGLRSSTQKAVQEKSLAQVWWPAIGCPSFRCPSFSKSPAAADKRKHQEAHACATRWSAVVIAEKKTDYVSWGLQMPGNTVCSWIPLHGVQRWCRIGATVSSCQALAVISTWHHPCGSALQRQVVFQHQTTALASVLALSETHSVSYLVSCMFDEVHSLLRCEPADHRHNGFVLPPRQVHTLAQLLTCPGHR